MAQIGSFAQTCIHLSSREWNVLLMEANQTLLLELDIQLTRSKLNSIKIQSVNSPDENRYGFPISATILQMPSSSFHMGDYISQCFFSLPLSVFLLPSFLPSCFGDYFLSFFLPLGYWLILLHLFLPLTHISSFTLIISCFHCISEILVINQGRELTNQQIRMKLISCPGVTHCKIYCLLGEFFYWKYFYVKNHRWTNRKSFIVTHFFFLVELSICMEEYFWPWVSHSAACYTHHPKD